MDDRLEIFGMVPHRRHSESVSAGLPVYDPAFVRQSALAHEEGGFDRVLIGYTSHGADGFIVAAQVAMCTERLGIMLAHRPGFVHPAVAARKIASLDHLSAGRLALHVISGGSDADQRRDGDYAGKDDRYARTDEYLELMQRIWAASAAVDHDGRFYRVEKASHEFPPLQARVEISFGGASQAALDCTAKYADLFMVWGQTRDQVRQIIGEVRTLAQGRARPLHCGLTFRAVLGRTEAEAWERADGILADVLEQRRLLGIPDTVHPAEGSRRLLEMAALGDRIDGCLWTRLAAITGGKAGIAALVGTPTQVAEALMGYWELGVSKFLIRGFDPIPDTIEYGRDLLPIFRQMVAQRRTA